MAKYGATRLREDQARALADWWGGEYRYQAPAFPGEVGLHGVLLPPHRSTAGSAGEGEAARPVFSLEDALSWDNRRSEVNPGAPEWVP